MLSGKEGKVCGPPRSRGYCWHRVIVLLWYSGESRHRMWSTGPRTAPNLFISGLVSNSGQLRGRTHLEKWLLEPVLPRTYQLYPLVWYGTCGYLGTTHGHRWNLYVHSVFPTRYHKLLYNFSNSKQKTKALTLHTYICNSKSRTIYN